MSLYYGVNCRGCGRFVEIGLQAELSTNKIAFYAMPLGPIPHECGASEQYGSDDVVDENGKPLRSVTGES